MKDDLNFLYKCKTNSNIWCQEDDLNFCQIEDNHKWPQFSNKSQYTYSLKAGLANPDLNWALHSSATACFLYFLMQIKETICILFTFKLWLFSLNLKKKENPIETPTLSSLFYFFGFTFCILRLCLEFEAFLMKCSIQ